MRAPSIDLLRVLRLATATTTTATTTPSSSLSSLRIPSTYTRPFSTCTTRNVSQSSTTTTRRRPDQNASAKNSTTTAGNTGAGAGTGTTSTRSSNTSPNRINPRAPKSHDRGPTSTEDTQTDFSAMDILTTSGVAVPATAIDACTHDGFHLNNGTQTHGGAGIMLLDGETFVWTPRDAQAPGAGAVASTATTSRQGKRFSTFLSKRGTLTIPLESLGVLGLLYPKPDLLIVGTGEKLWMLSRETRKHIFEDLGIKVDVMDTPNAAAAYNLLATERGVDQVAALMIPLGFRGL